MHVNQINGIYTIYKSLNGVVGNSITITLPISVGEPIDYNVNVTYVILNSAFEESERNNDFYVIKYADKIIIQSKDVDFTDSIDHGFDIQIIYNY